MAAADERPAQVGRGSPMKVSRSNDSDPSAPQRVRPEWHRNLFIVAPLLMSLSSVYFFSIRHLVDAWTRKSASMAEGHKIYQKLRGEGEEALNAAKAVGRQHYDRIVEVGKSDAATIIEAAEIQAKAGVQSAGIKGDATLTITKVFTEPMIGRYIEVSKWELEIAKLRIGLARGIDFEGDLETLKVKNKWPKDRYAQIRAERMKQLEKAFEMYGRERQGALMDCVQTLMWMRGDHMRRPQ